MLYIFFFFPLRWVSCTPNSTIGHLSIFTSRLTFSFLRGSGHLPLFIFSYPFSLFLEHSSPEIIYQVVVTKITRAFISQGQTEIGDCFWLFSRIRSRTILGGSGDGNEWIYVDAYFRSRSSMCE